MRAELPVQLVGLGRELPAYGSARASGLDLSAAIPESVVVTVGRPIKIPTGIAVQIPEGYEGHVRPRSGRTLRGLAVYYGTIDSDYRGEISVIVSAIGGYHVILPGERIAQLVIAPVVRLVPIQVAELEATGRGDGGFGSTGA